MCYASVELPASSPRSELPFPTSDTQDAPDPPLRLPAGCTRHLLLLIRPLRRRPSHVVWRPLSFLVALRHAISREINRHTQPRPTGFADVLAGAPRFTHNVGAIEGHIKIVHMVLPTTTRDPLSPALHPVLRTPPFFLSRLSAASSPPEHPVPAHLCIRALLPISLSHTNETVDVAAELDINRVSRSPTVSLLLDHARLHRWVNAFAKPVTNTTSKAATPSPALLIPSSNVGGRVDVHAEFDTTTLSRTPTASRPVEAGFPLDAVSVVLHLAVTIKSATPTPSTEPPLSIFSPAEVDVAAKFVRETPYATPTSCGSAIFIMLRAVANDEVGVLAKPDLNITSRTSTRSPQLSRGRFSCSWRPRSCLLISCVPSSVSCPPWDEALARAVRQVFTSVVGQADSLPRRTRSTAGRCWAWAPASPLCSAGHVARDRSPVPSVEPSDLGPEVPSPYAPTL